MKICIVGGGVVGLNIALELSERPNDIFLLEKEKFLGHHTSTRNSEVIHAGFAYPPGSLKAKLCVEGNSLTYSLLSRLGVPFRKCGKWIIACGKAEDEALVETVENAGRCSVTGLGPAPLSRLEKEEPEVYGATSAAFSETSGIMDAAAYIRALEVELSKRSNVSIVYPCRALSVDGLNSIIETDRGPMHYDLLINSAGLWADDIHGMTCRGEDFQMCALYQIVPFKGEYYKWRKGRVNTMIYPVPPRFAGGHNNDATTVSSMGIHVHRNIAGELFVGPSQVELTADRKSDYTIETPPVVFVQALSKFIKGIKASDLEPAYAGNRPKLYKGGRPVGDFDIFKEKNTIHLMGMESPALTAAPAIARHVAGMI